MSIKMNVKWKELCELDQKFDTRVRKIESCVLELREHAQPTGDEAPFKEALQQGEKDVENLLNGGE